MSAAKHTPGPWTAQKSSNALYGEHWHATVPKGDERVRLTEPSTEADARLIAAAPDMLEALRGFVDLMGRPVHEWDPDRGLAADARARAAIAKATGEQS